MKNMKPNMLRGLVYVVFFSCFLILYQTLYEGRTFSVKSVVLAVLVAVLSWGLILFLEKRRNRKKKQ